MNIQLQNVTYTYAGKYQRVTAVDGVSYTFHDGTCTPSWGPPAAANPRC